jgi:hypothetical protein
MKPTSIPRLGLKIKLLSNEELWPVAVSADSGGTDGRGTSAFFSSHHHPAPDAAAFSGNKTA